MLSMHVNVDGKENENGRQITDSIARQTVFVLRMFCVIQALRYNVYDDSLFGNKFDSIISSVC